MEVITKFDMTIPLWGIATALFAGGIFIVSMYIKLSLLENDMKLQKQVLDEIKALFYEFVKPVKK